MSREAGLPRRKGLPGKSSSSPANLAFGGLQRVTPYSDTSP